MSLTDTPNANRLHITLFGRRNSGKSSLINALTGQDTALVSFLERLVEGNGDSRYWSLSFYRYSGIR